MVKRPIVYCTVLYSAGILAAGFCKNIMLPISVLVSVVSVYFALFILNKKHYVILLATAFFFSSGYFAHVLVDQGLEKKYSRFIGEEITVFGLVSEEPKMNETGLIYTIKTLNVILNGRSYKVEGRIQVNTRSGISSFFNYGTLIKAHGILNLPKGKRNPGGFDYRRYLKCRKISAVMYVSEIEKIKDLSGFSLKSLALSVRYRIVRVINACLPENEAGLLNGMLIGYRDGLDEDMRKAFSDVGLTHIMAVSGANVLFITMPFIAIFKKLRLARRMSNVIVGIILIFFVFITGFAPSVVRAVIMALIMLGGKILYRETEIITSIALSALLLLVYNPFLLYDIGFQLSFAATLSLVFLYNPIRKKFSFRFLPATLADILAATVSAQAGVLPVTTWYFNQISIISLISNLVVIPLVQVVTILGTVMAVTGQFSLFFAKLPALLNYFPLAFIIKTTELCARLPYATITVPTPRLTIILLYYAFLFFLLLMAPKLRFKTRMKLYATVTAVIFVVTCIKAIIPGKLEVLFMDVGQGDAILITTPKSQKILIDGGGNRTARSGQDTGNNTVLQVLLDYGITRLDLVIATHPHEDHVQGLLQVIEKVSADKLVLPDSNIIKEDFKELLGLAFRKKVPVYYCKKGDSIILDKDVSLLVLHPDNKRPLSVSAANNASLVLKLTYRNIRILLTGDIEKDAEDLILESGVDLYSHLMKVAHHGSVTSTGTSFLKEVDPAVAVISVGNDIFGHPSGLVEERIKASGCRLYRTDQDGAIKVVSDGYVIKVTTMVKPCKNHIKTKLKR